MGLGKAKVKYVRVSARKMREVIELVKGKDVPVAVDILKNLQKASSKPLVKVITSCAANVKDQHKVESNELFVSKVQADVGPTLKRYRSTAMGRATVIRKRTVHITIELDKR